VAASWQVIGGIVAAFASPRQEAESVAAEADTGLLLQTLDARAIENGDEHVIKLTEAAEREYRRTKERHPARRRRSVPGSRVCKLRSSSLAQSAAMTTSPSATHPRLIFTE
jgi:hypothetical protein